MTRIRVISNPYKKEIKYQKLSEIDSNWVDIDFTNSKNSKLLSDDLSHGFFPFRATQILKTIIEEYEESGDTIEVYFDGSDDEFEELEEAAKTKGLKEKVVPIRGTAFLENARDILPEVKKLFQELSPLIYKSVAFDKIQRNLNRFNDAASDVVPVCVLGNYSAGKSTFINSLIGSEILPSGIEPVTAKIYKISRSVHTDRAKVFCQYKGQNVGITFTDKETKFEGTDSPLTVALQNCLSEMKNAEIVRRVNKALGIINEYENNTDEVLISDLIEVEIPFAKGVLAETKFPFVLFDTPGSNSASNAKHLQVLKQAMTNMTNGLPIFISTPDSLDSTDNENLYHIIRDMEELDSRFTMIVVNKADGPGLQRRESTDSEQNRVLSQAVPRNLYSGGLYYVSSILGLGSKCNGAFFDDFYDETYVDQVDKYSNPENRRYKTLYSYNILPAQIKQKSDSLAASQTDLIYANSGLFSIEKEIENFAGRYSSYNKCFQSHLFLNKVIQIAGEEIEEKKIQNDEERQNIRKKLEDDKKVLVDKLEEVSKEKCGLYDENYEPEMLSCFEGTDQTFTEDKLKKMSSEITDSYEDEMGYDDRKNDVKKSFSSVAENLKSNVSSIYKAGDKRKWDMVKNTAAKLKSDMDAAIDSVKDQIETRHQVDKATADKLLDKVAESYEDNLANVHAEIDKASQTYWTNQTEDLRNILAQIVAGSDVLTDERRKELERIIITYQQITFRNNEGRELFDRQKFDWRIKIGDKILWQSDHLNMVKLTKVYSDNFSAGIDTRYQAIRESHMDSAHKWIQSLLDEICKNIVSYSSELSKMAKHIDAKTEEIADLENRKSKLNEYTKKLSSMMDWKTAKN